MNILSKTYSKKAAVLRYDQETAHAPQMTAFGKGFIAEDIIERAKGRDVPI